MPTDPRTGDDRAQTGSSELRFFVEFLTANLPAVCCTSKDRLTEEGIVAQFPRAIISSYGYGKTHTHMVRNGEFLRSFASLWLPTLPSQARTIDSKFYQALVLNFGHIDRSTVGISETQIAREFAQHVNFLQLFARW